VAGSCEHGNEPSGSIKCGEFLDKLSVLLASQEGLCSMDLVSWLKCDVINSLILFSVFYNESAFTYKQHCKC
jgi:hypothetical protein